MLKCSGCDVETYIHGPIAKGEVCPNCNLSLDEATQKLNREVERLSREIHVLCDLAKKETGINRGVLIINAAALGAELQDLLK